MIPFPDNTNLYPYRLKPVVKDKVWGGRNLERVLGKKLEPGKLIGETWEAWEGCLVENGKHAGQTLDRVIDQDAKGVLGSASTGGREFPLLFKFIDAQQDLSVQVHPDDREAQEFERLPRGKTEAWYILDAEPNGKLILGFGRDVAPEQVRASIRDNTLVDLVAAVPVQRGDVLFVPAGTVHAIGKGIVLAEIQENSDITYRLYDWGRDSRDRPLHIDQSLRVLDYGKMTDPRIPALIARYDGYDRGYVVACRYFVLELLDIRRPTEAIEMSQFQIIATIEGDAVIHYGQGEDEIVRAERGQTILLPGEMGPFALEPLENPTRMLRAYVPDLKRDVVTPLRDAGFDVASIARLGGPVSEHNDLLPLLSK